MKALHILKKVGCILVLVMSLEACRNALPPFALTKGITKNQKNNGTSDGNSWNNNSQNGTDKPQNGTDKPQNGTDKPQIADKPDLVVVSLEPGTGMPVAGKWEVWEAETYENGVIATIKNEGTADITTLFKVGVYARHNNPDVYYSYSYLNAGTKIGDADVTSLKVGETKKVPIAISIPNDTNIGKNNYIGLWVDCDGNINESNEDNNKGGYNKAFKEYQRDDKTLNFIEIHENRPDIVAVSFNPPSTLYKSVQSTASVTIKNTGHRGTTLSFKVGVYARYNNPAMYYSYSYLHPGTRIGTADVTGLKAGETKELTIPLLITDNDSGVLNKTLYIGVWVDCDGNIKEMDRERKGDGDYNKGGYNGNTNSYEQGDLLKTVYYSE